MPPRTKPLTEAELAERRQDSLPDAVSEQALQRVSTGRVRYALSQLAQNNVEKVQDWLDRIELVDGPQAAFNSYLRLIEYSIPKLSRTEVKVEDSAGNAVVANLSMEDLLDMVNKGAELKRQAQQTVDGEATEVHK